MKHLYIILLISFSMFGQVDSIKVYYPNGDLNYEGTLYNGQMNGRWTYYYQSDIINYGQTVSSTGDYKNGKKEGSWTYKRRNGSIEIWGNYSNGKKNGKWTYFQSEIRHFGTEEHSVPVLEVNYKDDMLNGSFKRYNYFNNTLINDWFYKDHKRHGLFTYYYNNGNLSHYETWKNGVCDKYEYYYINGNKMRFQYYENGKQIYDKCWDENGYKIPCNKL